MTWLNVILISLQALSGLVAFLRERQMLTAGEAQSIAEALALTNERVAAAQTARKRARDSDPDPHDPYLRD